MRAQGRAAWRRFNAAMAAGRAPAREVLDGALVIFGGALLLTPGFLTDILGVLLLLPPTRALIRARDARRSLHGGGLDDRRRRAAAPRRAARHDYDVDGTALDAAPGGPPAVIATATRRARRRPTGRASATRSPSPSATRRRASRPRAARPLARARERGARCCPLRRPEPVAAIAGRPGREPRADCRAHSARDVGAIVEPLQRWTLGFDADGAADLRGGAAAGRIDPAEPARRAPAAWPGYEQLCRVEGTVRGGAPASGPCLGQRGHHWGEPDWERID